MPSATRIEGRVEYSGVTFVFTGAYRLAKCGEFYLHGSQVFKGPSVGKAWILERVESSQIL